MKTRQNEMVITPGFQLQDDDQPPDQPPSPVDKPSATISSYSLKKEWMESEPFNESTHSFIHRFFPGITVQEWNNWHWQLRNSITSTEKLQRFFPLLPLEQPASGQKNNTLPMRITPWYLSLIDANNPQDPLRKTMVPDIREMIDSSGEFSDPLSEGTSSPVPNVVHRYPDRVLFLATGFCAAYCRYCTRSHMVAKEKCHIGKQAWEEGLHYIANHQEIRDVIVSGGDPLTMPDHHIEFLLRRLREIKHVEIIRIGTKVPVVMPMRITKNLIRILRKMHPLYMSIHITHPNEMVPEVTKALSLLADAGIPLGSQTVLLRGVNDQVDTMKSLMHALLMARVRPYYLYQCDPIPGSAHFRTPVMKGLEIIKGLRGHTSGYAVPQYVIDAPGGGGKIPMLPDYTVSHENGELVLQNFRGDHFVYPDFSS